MTGRAVMVQGALAFVGLVAAYVTWQRTPELAAGEAFAVDIASGDLEKVRYEDQETKAWSELLREKDENGPFVAVHLSGSDASGAVMPSNHPTVPIKVPERLVRGNETASRLFEKMAPLRATRALGVLDAAKLKDLGLDTTKKHLEIVARGTKRRFALAPPPIGGTDPYIRDDQDGRVYIIQRSLWTDMQQASVNLVDRRLHGFPLENVDKVVVTAAGKKKEFRGSRIEELPGIRLTPAGADKADETAKNWHDRLWNLFPSEVLGRGEQPKEGEPKASVRVDYFVRGRRMGWVELGRATANESSSAATEPVYGRSEMSFGWMKMPNEAGALLGEAETLLSRP